MRQEEAREHVAEVVLEQLGDAIRDAVAFLEVDRVDIQVNIYVSPKGRRK